MALLKRVGIYLLINCLTLSHDSEASEKELTMSNVRHVQVSIDRSVYGVHRQGDYIWTLPRRGEYFIAGQYNSKAVDSFDAFYMRNRETALSERVPFPNSDKNKGTWRGPISFGPHLVFIDADTYRFNIYDTKDRKFLKSGDLIIDRVRPAADSRGEPTRNEISELRRKFINSWRGYKKGKAIFADFAELSADRAMPSASKYEGLALLRLDHFPLVSIKCVPKNRWFCHLDRVCYLPDHSKLISENLYGLAFEPTGKRLFIATRSPAKIHVFRYNSCFDIRFLESKVLPKRLAEISGMDIDEERALWLSISEPDPYSNGSVFRFDKY